MTTPNLASRINRIHVGSDTPVFLGNVETGTLLQNESKDAVIYVGQTDVTPANGIAITPGNSAVWQNESLVWAIVDPATADSGSLMVTTAISNVTQVAPYQPPVGTTVINVANMSFDGDGKYEATFDEIRGYEQIVFKLTTNTAAGLAAANNEFIVEWLDDDGNSIYYFDEFLDWESTLLAFPVLSNHVRVTLWEFNTINPGDVYSMMAFATNGLAIDSPTNVSDYQFSGASLAATIPTNPATYKDDFYGADGSDHYVQFAITTTATDFTLLFGTSRSVNPNQFNSHIAITASDCVKNANGDYIYMTSYRWPTFAYYWQMTNVSDAEMSIIATFTNKR